jgi:multidrug efflux system membrane fusion protein
MTTIPADSLSAHPPRSRARLWLLGFILLAGAAAVVWYFELGRATTATTGGPRGPGGGGPFGGRPGNLPVPVRVVTSARQNIDVHLRALGTVTPLNTVTVRSRLDGELVRVNFKEGDIVRSGQVLGEIDARPYEVQLAQALGQREENQARLKNAQADLERYQKLVAEKLIPGQQLTSQEATVQQITGALQSNDAQVNSAKLNLSYTKIVAPISGRLGLRQVDPGNLVRSGDANGIVVITQMRPISVIFTVPEADLPAVLEAHGRGGRLEVEAWDRADAAKLATGTLSTVDNQIDTTTGTIKLRASFDNGDEKLYPNQFVNVRLRVKTLKDATIVPAASIQRAAFGPFVYAVKPDNTVTIQRLTLGPTENDRVAVTSGLEPGTQVVLEGVDDLTEGRSIEIVPEGGAPARPRPAGAGRGQGGRGPGGGRQGGGGGPR